MLCPDIIFAFVELFSLIGIMVVWEKKKIDEKSPFFHWCWIFLVFHLYPRSFFVLEAHVSVPLPFWEALPLLVLIPVPVGCCSFGKSSLSCVFSLFFSTGSFPGTCKCAQPLLFYNNSFLKLTDHPPHLPLKVLSSFLLGSSFPSSVHCARCWPGSFWLSNLKGIFQS